MSKQTANTLHAGLVLDLKNDPYADPAGTVSAYDSHVYTDEVIFKDIDGVEFVTVTVSAKEDGSKRVVVFPATHEVELDH